MGENMSSFVVHTKIGDNVQECFVTVAQTSRWLDAAPAKIAGRGDVPEWANTIIVDYACAALPVLETPLEVAALHAMASQVPWFGFHYVGPQINMYRYDAETVGFVVGRQRQAGEEQP